MFLGRWNTKIDEKWRLYIPTPIHKEFGKSVLLREGEKDGCILIQKQDFSKVAKPSQIFVERIRNGGRVIIPNLLRNSTSFYYGKNVTIVGKGKHLEIWPRP